MENKGLIREVFRANFTGEEKLLLSAVKLEYYDSIAFDTEFPGFMINPPRHAPEDEVYRCMKSNVERTNLIQVGFTVFNSMTGKVGGVWQFNLSGFDPRHHDHNPSALEMLTKSGINLKENYCRGVKMGQFIKLLKTMFSIRRQFEERVKWVTFHGLYDVAYLLAAVHGKWKVPEDIRGFRETAGEVFSGGMFDVKCMARERGWMGLEKLAGELGAAREHGWAHQAGSDSLLTAKAFIGALQCSLVPDVEDYKGRLFGLSQPIINIVTSLDHHHHHRRIFLEAEHHHYRRQQVLPPRLRRPQNICFVPVLAPMIAHYGPYICIS